MTLFCGKIAMLAPGSGCKMLGMLWNVLGYIFLELLQVHACMYVCV